VGGLIVQYVRFVHMMCTNIKSHQTLKVQCIQSITHKDI